MTPLGWKYAGFVWGYTIVRALFTGRIKLLAYRILDPSALPLLAKKKIDLRTFRGTGQASDRVFFCRRVRPRSEKVIFFPGREPFPEAAPLFRVRIDMILQI